MKSLSLMLILLSITGCASFKAKLAEFESRRLNGANSANSPISSFIGQEITEADAKELAQDMAAFLGKQLPPAKTTLEIQPAGNVFYPLFREQLTMRGFGVVEIRPGMEKRGVFLRYRITQLHPGILVRMDFDGKAPSRYYDRGPDSHLTLQSSYTLREASK